MPSDPSIAGSSQRFSKYPLFERARLETFFQPAEVSGCSTATYILFSWLALLRTVNSRDRGRGVDPLVTVRLALDRMLLACRDCCTDHTARGSAGGASGDPSEGSID